VSESTPSRYPPDVDGVPQATDSAPGLPAPSLSPPDGTAGPSPAAGNAHAGHARGLSPCTDLCRIDESSGLCLGCARTLDEIAAWGTMDEARKRSLLVELASRRRSGAGRQGTRETKA
jgi:uncharacterized protein